MEGKYLITTDEWFYAPDGRQKKAVWGSVKIVEDSILGIKTNKNSTNWYAIVGEGSKAVIIAGCQIHYCLRCDERPDVKSPVRDYKISDHGLVVIDRPSEMYIAE